MGALRADEVPLPPELPPEIRGVCLGLVRDPSLRRASEICWSQLPAAQARVLLGLRETETPTRWAQLVAYAFAEWRLSERAKKGLRCARIVDGVCVSARRFFVLHPSGRPFSKGHVNSTKGPWRRLEKLGLWGRRQPRAGTSPYVGPRRCADCRQVVQATGCACGVPRRIVQWCVGQTLYQRAMCGPTLATLARSRDRRERAEARRDLARWLPWLAREREERAHAQRLERERLEREASEPQEARTPTDSADPRPTPQTGAEAPERPPRPPPD